MTTSPINLFQSAIQIFGFSDMSSGPIDQQLSAVGNNLAKAERYLIITAVACAVIGIVTAVVWGGVAIVPFVAAAALAYTAYNLHQVKTNIEDITSNPTAYISLKPSDQSVTINSDTLKTKLKENTLLFGFVVDKAVDFLIPTASQ